ncbi:MULTISPECIES: hypothetical protein [unclassified Myroides]|uniref:hypothetical protein n=1 Tax=unclassified Myroides TaxID=2642485 RepID=UPI0031012DB1
MKLKLFALLLTIVSLTSCSNMLKNQDFYLSNPTEKEITVTIDEQTYALAANSFEVVKVKPGIHTLNYEGKTSEFNVFTDNTGGIINPTLAPHYIFSMIYAKEGSFDRFKSTERKVVIDGILYEDNIKSTNALFIDNNLYRCKYMLGEAYPKEMVTNNKNNEGNFFNKFFTKGEFISFLSEEASEEHKDFHEKNKQVNGENTITEVSERTLNIPNFTDKNLQDLFQKQYDLVLEYRKSEDPKRQKEIQKELFDLSMSKAKMNINYSALGVEQNERMNEFTTQNGNIYGAGIIEL